MRLWNWVLTLIGKRFPLPPRHVLTYEEIQKYWNSLDGRWQVQCSVMVMRIRKPTAACETIWKSGVNSDLIWIPTREQIKQRFTGYEPGDPFTIRIDREWEVSPGMKRKEEVCIANFEL